MHIDAYIAYADDCDTPNGERGQCMPFSSCSDIEQRLLAAQQSGQRVSPEYASYLQKASCGEIDGVVCLRLHRDRYIYSLISTLILFLAPLLLSYAADPAQFQGHGVI